eukprot:TRINITY_DN9892_c0_g1_i1.p1 TRINITY_DN9892_c0_g1~~TRINITY_DN9892_c0_g1_i1.p1  ORF type:complete len:558 (-),score=88.89 TRINITY_DN9892_c0_g1_i1:22-1563(-)
MCTANHQCDKKCDYCSGICGKFFNHTDSSHSCNSPHNCPISCKFCSVGCCKNLKDHKGHTDHICTNKKCPHSCILCGKPCASTDHGHDAATDTIAHPFIAGKQVKLHLCSEVHECQSKCSKTGVCELTYRTSIQQLVVADAKSEYTYTEPIRSFGACKKKIPTGQITHDGDHDCDRIHSCMAKCPECGSFCALSLGHTGKHKTDTHRNKEHVMVMSQNKDDIGKIEVGGKVRTYKVGEVYKGEHCTDSCKRRGRAHFHLVECPGPDGRCQGTEGGAKHCTESFYPDLSKKYDKILCQNYWSWCGWVAPVEDNSFQLCSAYCPHDSHGADKIFCTKQAWHTDKLEIGEHTFPTSCNHITPFSGLDIAFVIDTTGSMSSFISASKTTINKIITDNAERLKKLGVSTPRFAVVEYKDHCDSLVTSFQDFTTPENATKYLSGLGATGGGDTPEAVFDGLRIACNLQWNAKHDKLLFHILDAPPHGRKYWSGDDDHPTGCPCLANPGTPPVLCVDTTA